MKQSYLIQLFLLLFCTVSCADHQPDASVNNDTTSDSNAVVSSRVPVRDTFAIGKVIASVICKSDASQSYALYIPPSGNNHQLPVIYFFDPHANGVLPLNKYKALADKYGFILIGSNNSKNGNVFSVTENIWDEIYADVSQRINIDSSRIYVCGFSGGAKVAGYIASNHNEIKAVIANSAALPDGVGAANFNFSFTGIAGDGDMNMTDVVSFYNNLDKTTTQHRLLLFNGKHEWAPEATMDIAFEGLIMDAMRSKQIPLADTFIKNYIVESKGRVDKFFAANNFIKAEEECKLSINMLGGFTSEANFFKEKDASIIANHLYQQQIEQQQHLFAIEQSTKILYQQKFQTGDIDYWAATIKDLNTKAKAQTAEGAMYNRLLAYLSLAFYSISNQLINANQNNEAQYFVGLYKMADPTNGDAWYFSAVLNARNNNSKATEDDLIKAAGYGFNEKERMLQQPEFQSLSLPVNFSAIEGKMNLAASN